MHRLNLITLLALALICTTCTTEKKSSEWIELFNGKDFTGWKASENQGTFKIENGMIVANGDRSHLFYVGDGKEPIDIKNFELSADVMTYPLANSGIYFHTTYQEEGWPEKGYEVQINTTHPGGGDYKEVKKGASLYGVRNVYKAFAKDSVWYNLNILVEGKHIRIKHDGMLTVDYIESSNPRQASGTFALQGHDPLSTVFFKNIKLKILPDSAGNSVKVPAEPYPKIIEAQEENFAFIDTHVIDDNTFNIDNAIQEFYKTGINIGVVADAPTLADNNTLTNFISKYSKYPVFLGITNSNDSRPIDNETIQKFDYVIGEITKFKSKSGKTIDVHSGDKISNTQSFMDDYVAAIITKINSGTIDIWANATLLPSSLASDYNKLWTKARMLKVIEAAKKNKVGIEINNTLRIPGIDFLKLAKEQGCLFANGGIYNDNKTTSPDYFLEAITQCALTYKDIYIPKNN